MSRAPISIHAPAKGATGLGGSNRVFVSDFNPRTREGCDVNMKKERGPRNLFQSTHPRRVRRTKYDYTCRCVLFQSTHPRRVRHARDKDQWQRSKFQSTHPRRVRHVRCLHLSRCGNISIHAPAKGATNRCARRGLDNYNFNPRTREGCDLMPFVPIKVFFYFNPRTREGCDLFSSLALLKLFISIHAPAKGATPLLCTNY